MDEGTGMDSWTWVEYTDAREALRDMIDVYPDLPPLDMLVAQMGDRILTLSELLDELADCQDTLPAAECDQLEIPPGSTYAQAVAAIRDEMIMGMLGCGKQA